MNNRTLKVKVTKGDWVIEIEGDAEEVKQQFQDIKRQFKGTIFQEPGTRESFENDVPSTDDPDSLETRAKYPHLKDVANKHLPGPEIEWLIVYAYYASNNRDKKLFTRDSLLHMYKETNRMSTSRIGNLSNNIDTLVKNRWIRRWNDTEFVMEEDGIKKAEEILSRTMPGKQRIVGKRKKTEKKENASGQNTPDNTGRMIEGT
jgi:hypothetical protein